MTREKLASRYVDEKPENDGFYDAFIAGYNAALRHPPVISSVCKCKGGAVGRTVTADFEHQICDRCGNIVHNRSLTQ